MGGWFIGGKFKEKCFQKNVKIQERIPSKIVQSVRQQLLFNPVY